MNNSKYIWIKKFNEKILLLLKLFENEASHIEDLTKLRVAIEMCIGANPNLPLQIFNIFAPKYREQITTRNDAMFTENNILQEFNLCKDKLSDINNIKEDKVRAEFKEIREIWDNMSSENKKIVWDTLNIMNKCSSLCDAI